MKDIINNNNKDELINKMMNIVKEKIANNFGTKNLEDISINGDVNINENDDNVNNNGMDANKININSIDGAKKPETSIGSAVYALKMSTLKQSLQAGKTATAQIDPYNTATTMSKVIDEDKIHVKKAKAPSMLDDDTRRSTVVEPVIKDRYQFKGIQ